MSKSNEPAVIVDFVSEELTSLTAAQEAAKHAADPLNSGFLWYTPPLAIEQTDHVTGGHHWIISGHDMQVLTMTVPPGETIVGQVGSFFFGSSDIKTEVEFTLCKGSEGCNRICGGEDCVKLLLTNDSAQEGFLGLTPTFPAKIIPLKFGTHIQDGHMLIAQPGAYMSQLGDVDVGCDLDCSCLTCCCGGLGCCRQKITGANNSIVFLNAGGTIIYRNLNDGETMTVDSRSLVAFEESVTLGVTSNGRCGMCCCGGEGCCSSTLTGPGKVFIQSMSFNRFKEAVTQTIERDEGGEE